MGKRERTKGHGYEREVARMFRRWFPEARRQQEYHESDCLGVDLQGTDCLSVQCKRFKGYAPISALDEVQPKRGQFPLLLTRGDRLPDRVVMGWPLFEFLMDQAFCTEES